MQPIIGLGAGGHAKVLVEILRLLGEYEIIGLLDPDAEKWRTQVLGIPVLGDDDLLPALFAQGVREAFIGLGGVGDTRPRRLLYEKVLQHGFQVPSIIHPRAIISPSARIGPGANIMPGAIINTGVRLGQNVIVNTGAVIGHDCVIDDHVHIATGARLAGAVHVKEGAHIGLGACIRQCLTVGQNSLVGVGAVVVKDIIPGTVVVGVPARVLRETADL